MPYDSAGKPKSGEAVTARGEKNGSRGGNGRDMNDEPLTMGGRLKKLGRKLFTDDDVTRARNERNERRRKYEESQGA
jgi:hypothetical protein